MADIYPESRVEEILVAMINGEEYTKFPESRIEALLIELLGKIIEVEGRGAYEFKGSVDFDELPETLTEDMAGWTYNMAEAFTTDERFVDGSGKSYPQGTNVSVANVGTDDDPVMMFDVPSAFVDVTSIYNTIHTVVANLASTFSDQIAYHTGDLVVKDDVLYKFTSDHAAGEWNPSHASTATLASLLIEVYNTITQVSNTIPTQLSQLTDDDTHRLVTDTEKTAWNGKQSALTFDSTPTEDSLNPVTSDGIFDALATKQNTLPVSVSSDDVTFQGDVTDGDGNSLSEIGSLCKSASGNPIVVNAQGIDAKELSVKLEPIQDLHGLPFPYVGGAYKNKLPMTVDGIKALNTQGTWSGNDYTIYGAKFTILTDSANNVIGFSTDGTTTANHVMLKLGQLTLQGGIGYTLTGCPSGGSFDGYRLSNFGTNTVDVNDIGSGGTITVSNDESYTFMIYVKNSGTVLSGKTFYPMLRLSTESDATFAPYSNICPISGRTEARVDDVGKNQLPLSLNDIKARNTDGTWNGNVYTRYNMTITVLMDGDKVVGINAKSNGNLTNEIGFLLNFAIPTKEYIINGCPSGGSTSTYCQQMRLLNAQGSWASSQYDTGNGYTITAEQANTYPTFAMSLLFRSGTTYDKTFYPMARHSGASATYEPYAHSSATIQLGTTVYGGTLNVTTGVLTITWIKFQITASNGEFNATNNRYIVRPTSIDLPEAVDSFDGYNCKSDKFVSITARQGSSGGEYGIYANSNIVAICGFKTSLSDYQTWLTDNPVDACYKLATPTTIQLTPTQLKLLEGYNYITADGEMSMVYIPENALGELYSMVSDETDDKIDALDAEDVDALPDSIIIASDFSEEVTYVKGKYVIYNGEIYRCKEYHAAGAWNASNFDPVTFGDELFDAASFNKFYGNANYDGTTEYKVDHSYVHQGTSNIPDYPSDGKAGTTNRFGILKTMRIDTGYIFQTLIVSYEGEPVDETPTIKSKFYYRSAIRINGTYVWGNWYETTGTEIV